MVDELNDDSVDIKIEYTDTNKGIDSLETGTPLKGVSESDRLSPSHRNTLTAITNGILDNPSEARQELDETKEKKTVASQVSSSPNNIEAVDQAKSSTSQFEKASEDGRIVKDYFHDLLVYINKNDATLADDRDGELAYFMRQMPAEELDMKFEDWLQAKVNRIKLDFTRDCEEKLRNLRQEFERTSSFVSSLEDEEIITRIANNLGLL